MASDSFKSTVKDFNVIGVDLGTTNSVVSIMRDGKPIVLKNELGASTTPSVVRLGSPELVGEEGKKLLVTDSLNTIFASKRLIGRKYKDLEIQEYLKSLPYKTVPSCNGDVWISTSLGKFSPAQIGAKVLNKMKNIAEKFLQTAVSRAVVTVPAYFNDSQRQATKDAGRIAGLDVIRVINEPTAAALAYGLDKKAVGNIAVYDLGGGTFDITILEVDDGVFHVKSTNGDTFLGGEDFDAEFMKFLINLHEQNEGQKLDRKRISREKLRVAAEKAKIELSTKPATRVIVDNITDGQDLDLEIKREQLESIARRVAQRTVEPCEKAVKDANISKKDIKHVILVGGMTRMPMIRRLVKDIFGIEPLADVDPDEVVAQGAAIQAGVLCGSVDNVLLLDVIPLSLGIETLGGIFNKIIGRNTTIPFKQTETFSTSEDNQTEVDIRIYQGERPLVASNKHLGAIKLKNIPPAPRGKPKIDVTFEADSNGIIKVSAYDSQSKAKQELDIMPSSGLTEEEIKKIISEAEAQKEKDLEASKHINLKNQALTFVKSIRKRSEKLPKTVLSKLSDLETMLETDSFGSDEVKKRMDELKTMF